MPKEARGQYDPVKCAAWYIRYLQTAIEKKTPPTLENTPIGERVERVRLLRAERELKEIRLSEKRSQLVAPSDVDKAFLELAHLTRGRIMSVPAQIAPQLAGQMQRTS
jgi:hypothetical protein